MLSERSQFEKATYCMSPTIDIPEKVKLWLREKVRDYHRFGGGRQKEAEYRFLGQ